MQEEIIWTTWNGDKYKLSELTHQHLSNIIHYMTHVYKHYPLKTQMAMQDELRNRFNGTMLPYIPCADFLAEIEFLKESGYLVDSGEGSFDIIINGKKIGYYDSNRTCAA